MSQPIASIPTLDYAAPLVDAAATTMLTTREHLADRQLPPALRALGVGVMTDIRAIETP